MIGTSTFARTSGKSTIVDTSRWFLNPPPSPPSTTSPSTPASTAFSAACSVGTTWNTVRPAALSAWVYFLGSPADVVTNFTPCSTTKSTMLGSRTNSCAMFTPNGRSVRSRILWISPRTASSSPDDVSMIPSAPAFETADAIGAAETALQKERLRTMLAVRALLTSDQRRELVKIHEEFRARHPEVDGRGRWRERAGRE